jgi:hypothetical protein
MSSDDDLPDVSPAAVTARLRAYVAEMRAKPASEWREGEKLGLAMAEDALRHEAEVEARFARREGWLH